MALLDEVEAELTKILEEVKRWIPADQLADMNELVRAGEPGVAFENLCMQLFEFDAVIPRELVSRLQRLGDQMGIKRDYWQRLAIED